MIPQNNFTWAELKSFINKLPDENLQHHVIIWLEDSACKLSGAERLAEEHWTTDGDGQCTPYSDLVNSLEGGEVELRNDPETYKIAYEAGHPILYSYPD